MSVSDSSIKGKFDELAGKAKQAFGDATGDQSVANRGATQEVKGHGEQAWGSVKEAVHDSPTGSTTGSTTGAGSFSNAGTSADNEAHDARSSVTSTAQNVKDHLRNAVDDLKR